MEKDIEKEQKELTESHDNIVNENNMSPDLSSEKEYNIENSNDNVLKEEIIDTTDPNKKINNEINSLDIDTTDPNKKDEVIEEKQEETKEENKIINEENKEQKAPQEKKQSVKKEKLTFRGCLSEFAVTAHQTSLEELLNKNFILTKHGNPLSSKMKENLLNNQSINSNSLIVIDGNKKPRKIYYDKKRGVITDKPLDVELAFEDKQAFKWYKLIVAAFYFLAKLIQSVINMLKYPLKMDEKACLDRALKNAFRTNTKNQKENKLEDGMAKAAEKTKNTNKDKKQEKEDIKEVNTSNDLSKENLDKDNIENNVEKQDELENLDDINQKEDEKLDLDKDDNLIEENEIENNQEKIENDFININKIDDPMLNLENEIFKDEEADFVYSSKILNNKNERLDKEPEELQDKKALDNNLNKENNMPKDLKAKLDQLSDKDKEFVNKEMKNNNIKDIEIINNDIVLKIESEDFNKNQIFISSLKDGTSINNIDRDSDLSKNLEKSNEIKIENKQ